MANPLYPLIFQPIFKDKIWGGHKIQNVLGKDTGGLPNCGETWEVSGVKGNLSVVNNGPLKGKTLLELVQEYKEELVGIHVYQQYNEEFPLLVKFIDANDDLSIQVHPHDELAQSRHQSLGKTEMWYVLQADPGAKLNVGFNRNLDAATYLEYLNSGRLNEILNLEEVKAGDVFLLPAGRVHYIGKGILLAEIQQTSDITYRIYDFDRTDAQGNKRELHTDLALEALDFKFHSQYKTTFPDRKNEAIRIATCGYFCTNIIQLDHTIKLDFTGIDSFVILTCCKGSVQVQYLGGTAELNFGEAMLIPASIKKITLIAQEDSIILESFCP